jgi:polysaccharide deacetylase 2 family uncharacterized protein YibQ
MAKNRVVMDRRKFILKSTTFFAGSLLGLNIYSRTSAAERSIIKSKIAIIIDDIGFSRSKLRNFLELDTPITFSILPRLEQSHALAEEIHSEGHTVMLHQPMEPMNSHIDPGPGALYVGDDSNKILGVIEENISGIPYVTGINNHMGSRFTTCQKEMKEALIAIKTKGLFFIDSLTTPHSMAYKTAKRLNITTACRNIFLDNLPEKPAILTQLNKLKRLAVSSGHAIGIGHPYPETAAAIECFLKELNNSAISMVHISSLIPA